MIKFVLLLMFFMILPSRIVLAEPCLDGDALDGFFEFIKSSQSSSTVDLFKKMNGDNCYSQLLESPILNPVSFALHNDSVTTRFPRIVLHHGDLTFMVVGNPTEPSSDILEIISFDTKKIAYRFSLVNFRAADPSNRFFKDAANVDFIQIAKTDPTFHGLLQCSECHALDATESRPRWGMPPLFQTPFGQANEKIYAGSEQLNRWHEFQKTISDADLGILYRFLKIRTNTLSDGTVEFLDKPNEKLATSLERLNLKRVGRLLRSSANYPRFQFALMAVLLGETNLQGYFTDAAWSARILGFKSGLETRLTKNKAMLQASPDQLLPLIAKDIEDANTESVKTVLTRVDLRRTRKFDLTGAVFEGRKLAELSEADNAKLILNDESANRAKFVLIRFLFEDSVSDKPLNWSTHVPFSFGFSHRFTPDFFPTLLRDELGPELLANYPQLRVFKQDKVTLENLKISREEFFARLKALAREVGR